jgi:hypothetical protein
LLSGAISEGSRAAYLSRFELDFAWAGQEAGVQIRYLMPTGHGMVGETVRQSAVVHRSTRNSLQMAV